MVLSTDIFTDHDNSMVTGRTTGLGGSTATDEDDRTADTVKPPSNPIADELRGKRMLRCAGIK